MAKTEAMKAQGRAEVEGEAERILDKLGLDASDAIRVFYKQIVCGRAFHTTWPCPTRRHGERCAMSNGAWADQVQRYCRDARRTGKMTHGRCR